MGRKPRLRHIANAPPATLYKPQGVPARHLIGVTLAMDGLEALRLVDAEGLDHATAAARMGVSRQTLGRTLAEARATVAKALSRGYAITIEGGRVRFEDASTASPADTDEGGESLRFDDVDAKRNAPSGAPSTPASSGLEQSPSASDPLAADAQCNDAPCGEFTGASGAGARRRAARRTGRHSGRGRGRGGNDFGQDDGSDEPR